MKKRGMVAVVAIVVFACSLLCTPVGAQGNPGAGCPSETKYYGTINGGIYFEQHGWMQFSPFTATFNDVPEGIKIARVYTGVWAGSPGKGGDFNITVNGITSPTYPACDPCPQYDTCDPWQCERCDTVNTSECHDYVTGCNVHFISYNATPYIVPGSNTVTVKTVGNQSCPRGKWDGRIYLIALLIVYEDASLPEMTYWINEGAPYMEKDSACDGPADHLDISFYFNGTHISEPAKVKYWTLGFPHAAYAFTEPAYTKLNGNNISEYDYMEEYGGYEVLYRWDNIPAGYLNPSSNLFSYHDPSPEYERVNVAVLVLEREAVERPDLIVTAINAYHNNTGCPAWLNLTNEIDVTVKNNGTATANASNVSLYIEDGLFGKLPVPSLGAGNSSTVTFRDWKPIGDDCLLPVCEFNWSYKDYNLTGVADCDNDVAESNETNNNLTVVDRACYNGYMADEPLENVAHGKLHGHLNFTTGDGVYSSLYSVGDTQTTNYDITIPAGASVKLAHLNVYYTWTKPQGTCPEMEVNITNATGTTYTLPLEKAYNDIKCTCPGAWWVLSWGNYVYDLTDYIDGSGTYTVTVKNNCTACYYFCPAAPGLVLVYEDVNAPQIEYWINEGADILMGGRRYPTSSNLAWWECMNNATFQASTETGEVVNATLGVVAPWGDSVPDDILFFNDVELGRGVYNGYSSPYSITIDSLTMEIGAGNAQVGINATDVTALYLNDSENVVTQADDGDNIMACNAFLVVEYEKPLEQPNLNVTAIMVNPDYSSGHRELFANQSNTLIATIKNLDHNNNSNAFNVSFEIEGVDTWTWIVRVDGLAAGNSTNVSINWTPVSGGTVLSPVYYNLTVTVDCDGEVSETNETNNATLKKLTVYNNGYKGKRYTGGSDIETEQMETIHGNLIYSKGNSTYQGGGTWTSYTVNWTPGDLPVPVGAAVKKARLYVYYTWDPSPEGINASMNFNGFNGHLFSMSDMDARYKDAKGYGSYHDHKYGTMVYNVKDYFSMSGNTATLTKIVANDNVAIYGMLLVVAYEDASEPERLIWINEECDLLAARPGYGTNETEATAYAPFTGTIDIPRVDAATLITVVPAGDSGAGNDDRLYLNDGEWDNVWEGSAGKDISINETDVKGYLLSNSNLARIQSRGDLFTATNAFLVVICKAIFDTDSPENPYPSIMGTHTGTITPNRDIVISRLYTYSCAGTGGHTESIELKDGDNLVANGSWHGYVGDYHNLTIHTVTGAPYVTLLKDHKYNYTIRTGSYPQIHHTNALLTSNGWINCTEFVDANGRRYTDWIPAIRLEKM